MIALRGRQATTSSWLGREMTVSESTKGTTSSARAADRTLSGSVPATTPLFGVNLGGYAQTTINTSQQNRYEIGGFTDKMFTIVDMLMRGRDADWPWITARSDVRVARSRTLGSPGRRRPEDHATDREGGIA